MVTLVTVVVVIVMGNLTNRSNVQGMTDAEILFMRTREPDEKWPVIALGWFAAPGGAPRFYFRCLRARTTLVLRAAEICSLPGLLSLHPDARWWRKYMPRESGGNSGPRIDIEAAGAWMIADCYAVGWFDPPPELRPRGPGRPREARSTSLGDP